MRPLPPTLLPLLLLLGLLLPATAGAQAPRRDFNCVGAEELEDEVFAVPFRPGSSQLTDAARAGLAAAAEAIKSNPGRGVCVLGHADREGGQGSNVRLAAARARAVSEALTRRFDVEAAQLRSEARVAGFSRRTGNRQSREASVVILPSLRPATSEARPDARPGSRPAAPAAAPGAPSNAPPAEAAPPARVPPPPAAPAAPPDGESAPAETPTPTPAPAARP